MVMSSIGPKAIVGLGTAAPGTGLEGGYVQLGYDSCPGSYPGQMRSQRSFDLRVLALKHYPPLLDLCRTKPTSIILPEEQIQNSSLRGLNFLFLLFTC